MTTALLTPATAREYIKRPKDQQFSSLETLIADATNQKNHSVERVYNAKDLHARSIGDVVVLESPKGCAEFTHWSFGQVCRSVGAPAGYLRELPSTIAANCIDFGLTALPPASDLKLLVQTPNGRPEPTVRACTSETYGRVWDAELYAAVADTIASRDGWTCEFATRSDRDSVVTLTNKRAALQDPSVQNIVNDPNASAGSIMYRSLTIGNSETGGGSVWYEAGLWRARCKNLQLWAGTIEGSFRRRHVGKKALRDTIRAINDLARQYIHQSPERDEAIIRQLITHEIATTREGVIDELRAIGFTEKDAENAYDRCEQTEYASPRSYWGIAQGATRLSQDCEYTDGRLILDELAAKVLARGTQLVRV